MKRTDLEKHKALKIVTRMRQDSAPGRPDQAPPVDRREQRRRDQELGLVAFAVKLDARLADEIRALAQARELALNDCVAELLRKGLATTRAG
jgi:hypothetical protein